MIPKTELRYSMVYNRIFDPKFNMDDFIKLREDCKKFEELYNKYINKIFRDIFTDYLYCFEFFWSQST